MSVAKGGQGTSPAWLHILAALRNPGRLGRSNPRQAKHSHTYPRKRADHTLRPPPIEVRAKIAVRLSYRLSQTKECA